MGALALGDIAGDLRGADDTPIGAVDGRYRERNVEQAAVLTPANGFEVIDALAAPQPRQNRCLLLGAIRWDHDCYRPADRFLGGVAEEPFRAFVPAAADAAQVLADDRVVA